MSGIGHSPVQSNNPLWPNAQPWDTLVVATTAVVVVLAKRSGMPLRAGVTDVLAPAVDAIARKWSEAKAAFATNASGGTAAPGRGGAYAA